MALLWPWNKRNREFYEAMAGPKPIGERPSRTRTRQRAYYNIDFKLRLLSGDVIPSHIGYRELLQQYRDFRLDQGQYPSQLYVSPEVAVNLEPDHGNLREFLRGTSPGVYDGYAALRIPGWLIVEDYRSGVPDPYAEPSVQHTLLLVVTDHPDIAPFRFVR